MFNPNDTDVTVRMTLRDNAGTVLGTTAPFVIGPMHQRQQPLFAPFTGLNPNFNYSSVSLSFEASAPIFVYASVLDNVTQDGIFVPAQEDPGVNVSP